MSRNWGRFVMDTWRITVAVTKFIYLFLWICKCNWGKEGGVRKRFEMMMDYGSLLADITGGVIVY